MKSFYIQKQCAVMNSVFINSVFPENTNLLNKEGNDEYNNN